MDRHDRIGLFNRWQRELPCVPRPFDAMGEPFAMSGDQVLRALREGVTQGEVSRVGAVFGVGAGGAGLLCALQVPRHRLQAVAERVNAEPAVNHNYAREHRWNLWFVVTAQDPQAAQACVDRIEAATGLHALRLPMRRAYRIDLGFDLFGTAHVAAQRPAAVPVEPEGRALAGRLEQGLPLVHRPWAETGAPLGLDEAEVLRTVQRWCDQGTVRRLGVVLRHHEFGISANAMTVFALPEHEVDAAGARLAAQPGVTLCYRREPEARWPYSLYCMVHGRERAAVLQAIAQAVRGAGLQRCEHEVLFSTQRFKQTGSRYFQREPA